MMSNPATGSDLPIGGRLAQIAARQPDAVATVERGAATSFGELDAHSTRIAHAILAASPEAGGRIALLFDSKAAAIRGMFGAARAGRTYVPLDLADPDNRLADILSDCQPAALLTEATLAARARSLTPTGCRVVSVDDALRTADAPLPDVAPDALLTILYTSGSTGQPKGVTRSHRNQVFFGDAYARTLSIATGDRLSFLYSPAFGAATMDVFGGLLNGATVCAYDVRSEGLPRLADWLDRERITILHAVPTLYRAVMRGLEPHRVLVSLRAVDLGGEAVFGSDVDLLRQHAPDGCVLVNHLGATEASVIAQHVVDGRSPFESGEILPAGVPPAGVRVSIRRADGSPAEPDEIGDIIVSSRHVSPGYWRRPELNAAAFSDDPSRPGWRRYATRDRGRIDADGRLVFIGRDGTRAKIRGHSVDLLEVESALSACAGVAEAAVVVTGGDSAAESERLAAYLVVPHAVDRDPIRLRKDLAARLPSYMVPAAIVFLDAFPLASSGKIDRRALSAVRPQPAAPLQDDPRDDLEHAIAEIVQRLLKVPHVGRRDDFFLLGGDSLSAIELLVRLRDTFGSSPDNLADDATVSGIAAAIRRIRASTDRTARRLPILIPVREAGTAPPLFIVHGRLCQAFVSRAVLDLFGDDQPVWSIQARGLDGVQPPNHTIEAMAADYVNEVRGRFPNGPYFIAALCAGAYIAAPMARALRDAGAAVLPLLLFDPPGWPPPQLVEGGSAITTTDVAGRLKWRQETGKFNTPFDDPRYQRATTRTVRAFERAIERHTPRPYDGPVLMLSSRDRMDVPFDNLFPVRLKRIQVSASHRGVLNPTRPIFIEALATCMEIVGAAAAAARTGA